MRHHISPREMQRYLDHSATLRSQAFGRAFRALGRSLRQGARNLVLAFF